MILGTVRGSTYDAVCMCVGYVLTVAYLAGTRVIFAWA
jgi:hypothetical protein